MPIFRIFGNEGLRFWTNVWKYNGQNGDRAGHGGAIQISQTKTQVGFGAFIIWVSGESSLRCVHWCQVEMLRPWLRQKMFMATVLESGILFRIFFQNSNMATISVNSFSVHLESTAYWKKCSIRCYHIRIKVCKVYWIRFRSSNHHLSGFAIGCSALVTFWILCPRGILENFNYWY